MADSAGGSISRSRGEGLRTARALFWVQIAHFALGLAAIVLVPLIVVYAVGLFENVQPVPVALAVIGALALAISIPALHLLSLVLATIVAVKDSGLIRIGAVIILIGLIGAFALAFSFSSTGDTGGLAEGIEQIVDTIGYVIAGIEMLAQLAGIVLLRIGISRARTA